MVVRVVGDHLGNLKLLNIGLGHGHADEAPAVGRHEVYVFRGGKLRRADEVPLIFPVRVVSGQDQPARPQVGKCLVDGVELIHVVYAPRL